MATPNQISNLKLALTICMLVAICNDTDDRGTGTATGTNTVAAEQLGDTEQDFGLVGSQRRFRVEFVPAQQQGGGMASMRHRRQVQVPPSSPFQTQGAAPVPSQQPGGLMGFFNNLGPQVEQAKTFTSLFSSSSQPNGGATGGGGNPFAGIFGGGATDGQQQQPSALSNGLNAAQLMSQLSEMIRSTQDRNAKMIDATQDTVESAGQQTASAAKNAQGGIQSALAEMGQGLSRLAANNPNLLPDIKNLYQSISAKLSSASSSVAQTASSKSGQEQLADQTAKALAQGGVAH